MLQLHNLPPVAGYRAMSWDLESVMMSNVVVRAKSLFLPIAFCMG